MTTVEAISFDTNYYLDKYEEYDIPRITKISIEDLEDVTDKLLGYLKDEENNLNIKKSVDGELEEVFGEREKLHMVDVKYLFRKGTSIRNVSLILVLSSFIALILKDRKSIANALILSSAMSFGLITILSLLMYINFNKYFTYFHEIFFTNDLWLLNPKTDVLIQMLPLEFFYSIATKIAIVFIFELAVITLIGICLKKCYRNSLKGND